jgi:urease accessory protein
VITAPSRVGRDGRLTLRFERRGERTVVSRCGYTLPLQVLAPMALPDPAAIVSVLNPTGGLVGGDLLTIDVEVDAGAHACLTTPSATKVYRSASAPAVQDVSLRVAPGARLEWVPDHTIPFAGAAYRQTLTAQVGDGAAAVIVDAFAAGRVARAEVWRFALLDSALVITDARGRLLHDRLTLRDGGPRGLGITEDHPYFATIVVIADAPLEAFIERAAAVAVGAEIGVAALPRRGAVVRCLATEAPALGAAIEAVWTAARVEVLGAPPLALRKP